MSVSLAIKYRPQSFGEVVEQSATKTILQQQLDSGEIKNAYLFCGSAGTGKTTCARIFANEINKGKGIPIELDAASNNSVDDVREIIQQAKTVSLDSEYKVFIMDEVHALSNQAWQAMLKVLEEPPAKSIFILCTTDPQKIPKTILSRVQRFNFQRLSMTAIKNRLEDVCDAENREFGEDKIKYDASTLEYVAKLANGGMRDALTLLDKCLAYSDSLTIKNVTKAVGRTGYLEMFDFAKALYLNKPEDMLTIVNLVYQHGEDLKLFIKDFSNFVLDLCKWRLGVDEKYLTIPVTQETEPVLNSLKSLDSEKVLSSLLKLQTDIKWDPNPKARIEAWCITGE